MASSKGYLDFILEQLSGLEEIAYRSMMGEYMIYYRGKVAAYVCDDRLLVKPVASAVAMAPQAAYEPPYEGAKPMLLIDRVDDPQFLAELFRAMYGELPAPKKKKQRAFFRDAAERKIPAGNAAESFVIVKPCEPEKLKR